MFYPKTDAEMTARMEAFFSNARLDPQTLAAQVRAELTGCCAAERSASYTFLPQPVHQNPKGFLHGGVTAMLFDHTMGVLIKCCRADEKFGPTVNLSVSYHRPIRIGEPLYIRTHVISAGKTLIHTAGECWQEDEQKPCASAVGIFYLDG